MNKKISIILILSILINLIEPFLLKSYAEEDMEFKQLVIGSFDIWCRSDGTTWLSYKNAKGKTIIAKPESTITDVAFPIANQPNYKVKDIQYFMGNSKEFEAIKYKNVNDIDEYLEKYKQFAINSSNLEINKDKALGKTDGIQLYLNKLHIPSLSDLQPYKLKDEIKQGKLVQGWRYYVPVVVTFEDINPPQMSIDVDFRNETEVFEGQDINFEDLSKAYPIGYNEIQKQKLHIIREDGTNYNGVRQKDPKDKRPKIFLSQGKYKLILEGWDIANNYDKKEGYVTVKKAQNQAPQVVPIENSPTNGEIGQPFLVSAKESFTNDGIIQKWQHHVSIGNPNNFQLVTKELGGDKEEFYYTPTKADIYYFKVDVVTSKGLKATSMYSTTVVGDNTNALADAEIETIPVWYEGIYEDVYNKSTITISNSKNPDINGTWDVNSDIGKKYSSNYWSFYDLFEIPKTTSKDIEKDDFNSDEGGKVRFNTVGERELSLLLKGAGGSKDTDSEIVDVRALPLARLEIIRNKKNREVQIKDISWFKPQDACQDSENAQIDDSKNKLTITRLSDGAKAVSIGGKAFNANWVKSLDTEFKTKQEKDKAYNHEKDNLTRVIFVGDHEHDQKTEVFKVELEIQDKRGKVSKTEEIITIYGDKKPVSSITGIWNYIRNPFTKVATTELYEASHSLDEDDIEVTTKQDGSTIQPNATDRKLNIVTDKVGENKIDNTVIERFIEKTYSGLKQFLFDEDELRDIKNYILNVINIAPTASLKGIKSSNVNMISYIDSDNDISEKVNTMIQDLFTENKVKIANTPLVYKEDKGLYKTKSQGTSKTVLELIKSEIQLRSSSGLTPEYYKFYPIKDGIVVSKVLGNSKVISIKKVDGSTKIVATIDKGSKELNLFLREIPILDDTDTSIKNYIDIETLPLNLKYSELFYKWDGSKYTYVSNFETNEEFRNTFYIDNGKVYINSLQCRELWYNPFYYQSFMYDLTTKTTQYYNEDEKSMYIKLKVLNYLGINFNTSVSSLEKLKAKIGENYSSYLTKPKDQYRYKITYGVETATYIDFYIQDTNDSSSTYIDTIKYYRYNKVRNSISLLQTLTFNKAYSKKLDGGYTESNSLHFIGKVGDKYMLIYLHSKPLAGSQDHTCWFDTYVIDSSGNILKTLPEFQAYGNSAGNNEIFYKAVQGDDNMLTYTYSIKEYQYNVKNNTITYDRLNNRLADNSFVSEYEPFFYTPYRILLHDNYDSGNKPRYATLNLEDDTTRQTYGYWHNQGFTKRKEFAQSESWQTLGFTNTYLKLNPNSPNKEIFGNVVGYEDNLVYINTSSGLTGLYPNTNETVNFNIVHTKPTDKFLKKVDFDYRDLKEYDGYELSPKFIDFTYKLDNINITKQNNNFLTLYINKDIMFGDIETQILKDRIDYLNERNNLVTSAEKIKLLIVDVGGKNEISFQTLLSQIGGQYFKVSNNDEGILKVKEYIQNISGAMESSDTIKIKQGDIIDIVGSTIDYEEDPLKLEQYRLKGASWGSFGANSGIVKKEGTTLQFNNKGTFIIEYQSKDNPPSGDGKDYGKFSNIPYVTVIVGDAAVNPNPEPPGIDVKILSIDGENKGKERRKVDFIIQGIKGTNTIDWNSLKVSFDKEDYLPTLAENSFTNKKAFSRIFTQIGTHNVTVELADVKGLKRTVTIPFEIIEDVAPTGDFDIEGDGKRNPDTGLAQYFIDNESASSPDGDDFETIYYNEVPKYKFTDGKLIQDGLGWGEIDVVGGMFETDNNIKIKQLVQEQYENGKGLNNEALDKEGYRVFKTHEVIKEELVVKAPPTLEYKVKPPVIIKGESVSHFSTISDDTNKPKKQEFKFVHDPNVFQNNQGANPLNGVITSTATEQLNYKGEYHFYSQIIDEDNMTSDWVDGGIVNVVSKPIANFEPFTNSTDSDNNNKEYENDIFGKYSDIEINNKAYNEDFGNTREDHGFKSIKMEYRNIEDDEFTEFHNDDNVTNYPNKFTLPSEVSQNNGIYQIKQSVVSIHGIESECIKTIKIVDFKLKAQLEPSLIHPGQVYKIKAKTGKDAISAIAYIPYLDKYVDLIESYEEGENKYYEIPIPTLETMRDGDYPIVVYASYPYNLKKRADLTLKVYTPIAMASDAIPLGPEPYNVTLNHNSPDGDRIRVAASENIRIEAAVNCPITVTQVEAWLHDPDANQDETSSFLWYNTTSKKWEGMVSVASTKIDKNYEVKLRATAINEAYTENKHYVNVNTPINLVPNMPDLIINTENIIKAVTTKYPNTTKVDLFFGTDYKTTLNLSDSINQIKKDWSKSYTPSNIPDGNYIARFTSTTPNGNIEIKDEPFKLQALDLKDLRITNIVNHNNLYKDKYPIMYSNPDVPVGYKAGYYVTFKINAIGNPDTVKMKISYPGYSKEFKMKKESSSGINSVWMLEWYADPFTKKGTIINTRVYADKDDIHLDFNDKYNWDGDYLKVIGTIEKDVRIDLEF